MLLGGGVLLFHGSSGTPTWAAASDPPAAALAAANDLSAAFRYASERVIPSVVTIRTVAVTEPSTSSRGSAPAIPEEFEPLLKRFFGEDLPRFDLRTPRPFRQEGMGSGVIIDPSGVILTNNHVVGGGAKVKVIVRLHDGREFTAEDVKSDPKTDLAIVRIEGAGTLPAAPLGDSDAMQIGDWVLAIGNPFGLSHSVTAGIISAKSRGMGITEREDFLQTDAAINPGNSGGPLVNLRGEVIGINTAISTRGGGSDGVGFAVPINLARWVGTQLVEKGSVQRAFLGLSIQQVSSDLSKQFGLNAVQGALVTEVRPDSAAAKAGVQVGDVVVEFDGRPIHDPRDLQNVVERSSLDQPHKLTVLRNGERLTLDVKLQPMPQTLTASRDSAEPAPSEFGDLGLEVATLTPEVAEQLGMSGATGVVITSVAGGSLAEELGLREGMVITRVGRKEIHSVEDFRDAVKDADLKTGLLLLVRTAEGSRFIVLMRS
jgi:serine protease Do